MAAEMLLKEKSPEDYSWLSPGLHHSFLLSPGDQAVFLILAFRVGALLLCFLPLAGRALAPVQVWTWPAHNPMRISPAEPGGESPPWRACSALSWARFPPQQSMFYPEPKARGFIVLI